MYTYTADTTKANISSAHYIKLSMSFKYSNMMRVHGHMLYSLVPTVLVVSQTQINMHINSKFFDVYSL